MGTEGFIAANKTRLAVFNEIRSGETDPERIAKKQRMIEPAVKSALEDLLEQNIIEHGDDGYSLTDEGRRAADQLKQGHP